MCLPLTVCSLKLVLSRLLRLDRVRDEVFNCANVVVNSVTLVYLITNILVHGGVIIHRVAIRSSGLPRKFSNIHVTRVASLRLNALSPGGGRVGQVMGALRSRGPSVLYFANSLMGRSTRRNSRLNTVFTRIGTPLNECTMVKGRSCNSCTR